MLVPTPSFSSDGSIGFSEAGGDCSCDPSVDISVSSEAVGGDAAGGLSTSRMKFEKFILLTLTPPSFFTGSPSKAVCLASPDEAAEVVVCWIR